MERYRGSSLIQPGVVGVVLIVLIITVGLQPQHLLNLATAIRHQALFTEAGGIMVGNDVTLSGMKIGSVTDVGLRNGDALVTFTTEGRYPLGSQTTAHIRTGSLLGERVLALESDGSGTLPPSEIIPTTRTSSPYSLTDAIGDLTSNTADTDTGSLNASLDTLSQTLDEIAPQQGRLKASFCRGATCVSMIFLVRSDGSLSVHADPAAPLYDEMDGHLIRWMRNFEQRFSNYRCMAADLSIQVLKQYGAVQ